MGKSSRVWRGQAVSTGRELLFRVTKGDFTETHIRGSGPGGQHRNKTSTGVRLTHRASGAVGEATDSRSQSDNRTAAFQRLRATSEWRVWFNEMCLRTMGLPSVEEKVEAAMAPDNIRTQVLEGNRWVDVPR